MNLIVLDNQTMLLCMKIFLENYALMLFAFLEIWCDTPPLRLGMRLASVTQPRYPRGEKLYLACSEGYVARGNLEINCQSNGRWTRPDGDCQSKTCK